MTVEPERRRSRFAWPNQTEPTTTPAGTHSHRQRNGPVVIAYVAIVLLLLVNAALAYFVWLDHQYVQGRGEYRDQETARLEQRITDAVCDLLDQLPEGGLLDRPRAKYGCGPGIPLDQLTPEEQAQLQRGADVPSEPAQALVPVAPAGPEPEMGDGASVNRPPRPATPPPPPRPTMPPGWPSAPPEPPPAAPTTSPAPERPLGPIVDLLEEILP